MSAVASKAEEDYELRLWMLNLFAHYVAVNKNWFETADELKYWGKLFLSEEYSNFRKYAHPTFLP